MILEAFSHVLKAHCRGETTAAVLLQQWLLTHLLASPHEATTVVHHVLQAELEAVPLQATASWGALGKRSSPLAESLWVVHARGKTGEVLLNSLMAYCQSYEDWQYRRWLHHIRPGDFSVQSPETGV
jgi:hypothetical protein